MVIEVATDPGAHRLDRNMDWITFFGSAIKGLGLNSFEKCFLVVCLNCLTGSCSALQWHRELKDKQSNLLNLRLIYALIVCVAAITLCSTV